MAHADMGNSVTVARQAPKAMALELLAYGGLDVLRFLKIEIRKTCSRDLLRTLSFDEQLERIP